MFTGLMTGVSGIRGIIGEGMTPEVATLWAGGFGSWVKGNKVVVARDTRVTGDMLNMAVKAALSAAGCDVDDIGITTTPAAALAVERRNAGGGIIITASHNPQDWNAMKFVRGDGRMLTAQDFIEFERMVSDGPLRSASWDKIGRFYDWEDADITYISAVLGLGVLDLERIKKKKFKVAIDCVNGAGSEIYPLLLEAFGCEVIKIHCDSSGRFPRGPEPTPANLSELSEVVKQENCAIGFAVDPDGDRLSLVDETGLAIGEEASLAIAIKSVLEKAKGPIVINALTSLMIEDVAKEYGVECHRTKVGEANVAAGMKEFNAVVGGEGNGGIMLTELHLVRDAGAGMALALNHLAKYKRGLHEHYLELPNYHMIKDSFRLTDSAATDIIENISMKYEHDQISRIDGLRISYDDGWVQIRASNTEPILRVYSEAKDENLAKELIDTMFGHLSNFKS